jgi:hypothetical protein
MSNLLGRNPYGPRDNSVFLAEVNRLTAHHAAWCEPYGRMFGERPRPAANIEDVPYVHVGLFKRMDMITQAPDTKVVRSVLSSSTSGLSSRVSLDALSSRLQSASVEAILRSFIGSAKRPLLILDSGNSLRRRDDFSARIMAALSLKPFATEVFFLLKDAQDPASFNFAQLECALRQSDDLLVYGFSWMLWLGWAEQVFPETLRNDLTKKIVHFVHSGGWKKLEEIRVEREQFDTRLISTANPASQVVDYYGLVEQMGIIYPLCEYGFRHVPVWGDVLVRDSWTGAVLDGGEGQLQLLNSITYGAPCHSVLTEDMGRLISGPCCCGREGKRFELIGRVPKAEIRGCANVGSSVL